jgi:hypothetical protein
MYPPAGSRCQNIHVNKHTHKKTTMAAVSNDSDSLPIDQYGNNVEHFSDDDDDEDTSVDLLQTKKDPTNLIQITPDRKGNQNEKNEYMFPMERVKRVSRLPLLPTKPPKLLKISKLPDPKPTNYFPQELDLLESDKQCVYCKHTTCHDLLYGDYCGLQATEYAKSRPKGLLSDVAFESKFSEFYTSSLKYHRYLSTGVIDMVYNYKIPECMKGSSYRNFHSIYKINVERKKLERHIKWSGKQFGMRKEPYSFDTDGDDKAIN